MHGALCLQPAPFCVHIMHTAATLTYLLWPGHVCAAGCRRQIAKWRHARSFVCLLVEEAAAADGSGQPGRLLGTATLSLMQVG
jgi:hypothetical protein